MGYSGGKNIMDYYVDSSKNAEEYQKRNQKRHTMNIVMIMVVLIPFGFIMLLLGILAILLYFSMNSLLVFV